MEAGYREVTLRPRGARPLAVLVVALCAGAGVGFAIQGDLVLLLRAIPPLALTALTAWAAFWRPEVRVGVADLDLVNVLRSVRIAWPAVSDVETRWGLTIATPRGRYAAWAAPRTGAASAAQELRADMRRVATGGTGSAGTREGEPASVTPLVVLRRWSSYRDAGLLGPIEGTGVEVRWHAATIVALGLLVLATLAAAIAL